MKQISKIFFGLLFVSGLFLTLPNQMFAQYQAVPIEDGSGGGGGGGTTTTTANATIPTAATAFNLTANLDKSSYNTGDSMTLTSLVSMSTCLNSASNFLVTGTILDSGNSPTTISDFRNPDMALYGSTGNYSSYAGSTLVGGASFKAPSTGGDYFIRIDTTYTYLPAKLIIKKINGISYLYDMSNNIYYATKLPVHNFGSSFLNPNYEISTDISGKVLIITDIGGTSDYGTGLDGLAFTDIVSETRTISTYVPFTVVHPAPTVTVTATNTKSPQLNSISNLTVPFRTSVTISWEAFNATSCTPTSPAGYEERAGHGLIGHFDVLDMTSTTNYTVTCNDNQPLTLINGACSATHYSCNTGTSVSHLDNASNWSWSCSGSNGGTTASCSENKPPVYYCAGIVTSSLGSYFGQSCSQFTTQSQCGPNKYTTGCSWILYVPN